MQNVDNRLLSISDKVKRLVERVQLLSSDNKFLKEENNRIKEELLELKTLNSQKQNLDTHGIQDNQQAITDIKDELKGYVAEIDSCIKILEAR